MKRVIFYSLIFLLTACAPKIIPISGKYQDKPFVTYSKKSKDQVWDKIIELFATKGISIKLIDRSSGLIISEKTSMIYTYEKTDGSLKDTSAWVVIPKVYSSANPSRMISTYRFSGEWNVRLKQELDSTLININLLNIDGEAREYGLNGSFLSIPLSGKSLGNFEKTIAGYIQ